MRERMLKTFYSLFLFNEIQTFIRDIFLVKNGFNL